MSKVILNDHPLTLDKGLLLNLVDRLESYQREAPELFRRIVEIIDQEFVPAILLHAMTGMAKITSDNEIFANPLALSMLVDILNERGYRTCATAEMREVPSRFDPATHYIICTRKPRYRFELLFQGSRIRRGTYGRHPVATGRALSGCGTAAFGSGRPAGAPGFALACGSAT